MTTYTSEPGTRLGGRYRLEDRIAAGAGWDAWKAIDETLARAVTVFTFAPGFPRTGEVVTAARAASRLTDPRAAQVFDVEEAWERAYIVMEWAAGETLGDLISQGPLEPNRAGRMMAEAAAAISVAHAAGIAHMCLSPGSVRWSQTGEVKVVGLGIDAALSAISSEDPVLADTVGLGKLLYAALTGYWPGPEYPSLPPAPLADGEPRSPRQVVAGVPAALSDLACRAMQLRSRGAEPFSTPEQLARALLAAVPPTPVPPAPVPLRRTEPWRRPDTSQDGDYRQSGSGGWGENTSWDRGPGDRDPDGWNSRGSDGWAGEQGGRADDARRSGWDGQGDQLSQWPGDDRQGRDGREPSDGRPGRSRHGGRETSGPGPGRGPDAQSGRGARPGSRRAGTGARRRSLGGIPPLGLVAAGVGALLVVVVAFALLPSGGPGTTAKAGGPSSTPTASAAPLTHLTAAGFDPLTSQKSDPGNEQTQYADNAIDGNPKTSWQSQWYASPQFGGLKAGSGLMLDLGEQVRVTSVTIDFGPTPGGSVKLLAGNSDTRSADNLASMHTVATAANVSGSMTIQITSPAAGRYLVIWFTQLPPKPGSHKWYMAQVFEVSVRASA